MDFTTLGRSDLTVSRIALGCMGFGDTSRGFNEWALGIDDALPLILEAVELGITFWDTANVYGFGSSEEVVGLALKKLIRREEIVLATKVHQTMHHGPGGSGLSRGAIMENINASLKRLGTDYVDLYQIHRFDPETPVEETMEALHDVVEAGKARYLGASSMWAWQFSKLQYTASTNGWHQFVSMQDHYNLLHREEEREMFGLLDDQGVSSIPWSPLAKGMLARRWGTRTTRSDSDPILQGRIVPDFDRPIVDVVQAIAHERGVTMAQVALAWVLRRDVVSSAIVGPSKRGHLAEAASALAVRLSDEEVRRLEEKYAPRLPTGFV
jgi:aryl-alcohol dehydrogenase-like predicted oxidoreductase